MGVDNNFYLNKANGCEQLYTRLNELKTAGSLGKYFVRCVKTKDGSKIILEEKNALHRLHRFFSPSYRFSRVIDQIVSVTNAMQTPPTYKQELFELLDKVAENINEKRRFFKINTTALQNIIKGSAVTPSSQSTSTPPSPPQVTSTPPSPPQVTSIPSPPPSPPPSPSQDTSTPPSPPPSPPSPSQNIASSISPSPEDTWWKENKEHIECLKLKIETSSGIPTPLQEQVARAILESLPSDRFTASMQHDIGVFVPKDDLSRFAMDLLDNYPSLLNQYKGKIFYKTDFSLEQKNPYFKWQRAIFKQLIDKNDTVNAKTYLSLLYTEDQLETLAAIQELYAKDADHPWISTHITPLIKDQVIFGYPVTNTIVENESTTIQKFSELKPGDLVLRKSSNGSWKVAKVESIDQSLQSLKLIVQNGLVVQIEDCSQVRKLLPEDTPTSSPPPTSSAPAPRPHTMVSADMQQSAEQYGNKSANLIQLESICNNIENVTVPAFLPLSNTYIQDYIQLHYSNYNDDWGQFVEHFQKSGLDETAREKLQYIQNKLEAAFKKFTLPEDVARFLESQADKRLMVRSTGKEDSAQSSNAGGNRSVAGVAPTANAVAHAIGTVVASYHSPLSITQRLLANETITEHPFTPVLLQTMIGEPTGNSNERSIPVSGVLYTQEILGKTEQLYQIQATYGHNEAVVNSQLPVDTHYVYPDGTHHDLIRHKPHRLVANDTGGFHVIDNPKKLAESAALTHEQITSLQKAAQIIQERYGRPMDIEWVLDRTTGTICIVQARPIVERAVSQPSYIDVEKLYQGKQKEIQKFSAEAIVSNGGVVVIQNKNEIISDTNLEKAFGTYWRMPQNEKEKVKAVLVQKPAVGTSHFACTLREMGVAVFYSETVTQDTIAEGYSTILDPQRGAIFTVQGNIPESAIAYGWYSHPIPAKESIQQQELQQEQVTHLYETLVKNHTPSPPPTTSQDWHILFNQLASSDVEEGNKAIKDLMVFAIGMVKHYALLQDPRSLTILRNIAVIGERFLRTTDRLERLHAVKRLEALFSQQSAASILNSDSLFQFIKESKLESKSAIETIALTDHEKADLTLIENRAIEKIKKAGASHEQIKQRATPLSEEEIRRATTIYSLVEKHGISTNVKEKWHTFTTIIASSKSRYANSILIDLIHQMGDLNVFEQWLNNSFLAAWEKICPSPKRNAVEVLKNLFLSFNQSRTLFSKLAKAQNDITAWKERESFWANPDTFEQLNSQFSTVLEKITYFRECFNNTDPSNILVRSAIMKYLHTAIDTYDSAIKSMKSSPLYENKSLQAERFKQLLIPYEQIMQECMNQIPDETINLWTVNIQSAKVNFKQTAIKQIEHQLQAITQYNEGQLRPSGDFNVAAAAINSAKDNSQNLPQSLTLEDVFTLIHQNILASFIAIHQDPWAQHFPQELLVLEDDIQKTIIKKYFEMDLSIKGNRLGSEYNPPNLCIKYNIPLKNHSAVIDVTYNLESKNCNIHTKILGHNRNNRMDLITDNLIIQAAASGFLTNDVPYYDTHQGTLHLNCELNLDAEADTKIHTWHCMVTQACIDTLEANFGAVSTVDFQQFDQDNPEKWDAFCNSPVIRQWCAQGARGLSSIIKRFQDKGWDTQYRALMQQLLGVEISSDQDASLDERIARAILGSLPHTRFTARPSASYIEKNELSVFAIKLLQKYSSLLPEYKEKILYTESFSPEQRAPYVRWQMTIFEQLIKEGVDTAKDYLSVLHEKKQLETLAAIQELYAKDADHPWISTHITPLIKDQVIFGYPVTNTIVENESTTIQKFSELKPGDLVLRKSSNGSWKVAKVESIDENPKPLKLLVQGGQYHRPNNCAEVRKLLTKE